MLWNSKVTEHTESNWRKNRNRKHNAYVCPSVNGGMGKETTHIRLYESDRKRIAEFGEFGETYPEVVRRVVRKAIENQDAGENAEGEE